MPGELDPVRTDIYTVDKFPEVYSIWDKPNPALVFDHTSLAVQMNIPKIVANDSTFGVWGPDGGDGGKGRWLYEIVRSHVLAGLGGVAERPGGSGGAGHTVYIDGKGKIIFRILPSAPEKNWTQIAGRGELVRLDLIGKEMDQMKDMGIEVSQRRIMIDGAAFLVWDAHIKRDEAEEERRGISAIGTTKSGVGPAASDYSAREGLRVGSLLLPEIELREKVAIEVDRQNRLLDGYYSYNPEEVYQMFIEMRNKFGSYIQNTHPVVMDALRNGVLAEEGAQGFRISLDTGFQGSVTSTDSGPGSFERRHRTSRHRIKHHWGATKLVPTFVGKHLNHAPLPEHFQDLLYARTEVRGDAETGAVSGRRRKYTWMSIPELRAAVETYGLTALLISKVDVCDQLPEIHLGMEYVFPDGTTTTEYDPDDDRMKDPRTRMNTLKLDGWESSTAGINDFHDAHDNLKSTIHTISELVGVPIIAFGTGPYFGEAVYADNSPFAVLKELRK